MTLRVVRLLPRHRVPQDYRSDSTDKCKGAHAYGYTEITYGATHFRAPSYEKTSSYAGGADSDKRCAHDELKSTAAKMTERIRPPYDPQIPIGISMDKPIEHERHAEKNNTRVEKDIRD